jgi:hypothetical protein
LAQVVHLQQQEIVVQILCSVLLRHQVVVLVVHLMFLQALMVVLVVAVQVVQKGLIVQVEQVIHRAQAQHKAQMAVHHSALRQQTLWLAQVAVVQVLQPLTLVRKHQLLVAQVLHHQ